MKKIFSLIVIFVLTMTIVNANEGIKQSPQLQKNITTEKVQRMEAFEKRLGLTEEQKLKAKDIRIKGHEKLKPIIEQIVAKNQEAKMVKMSRIAVQVQEERLNAIDKDLKILEKRAHDLKRANMKEFESILTRQQKKILKDMKKEGRKRYHSTHPSQRPIILPASLNK